MSQLLTDRFVRAGVVFVGIALAGVIAMVLSWRGSAATLAVWLQMPFFVSGAMVGLGLIGTGIALLSIHLDRQYEVEEEALFDEVLRRASDLR